MQTPGISWSAGVGIMPRCRVARQAGVAEKAVAEHGGGQDPWHADLRWCTSRSTLLKVWAHTVGLISTFTLAGRCLLRKWPK